MNNDKLKITLVFEENPCTSLQEILDSAASAHHFTSREEPTGTRYYATFLPHQAAELFSLFRKIEKEHRLQILLNGKLRPFTQTLWLPLLWFLENKREPEGLGEKYGD
jgi:hypothetical protein